MDNCSNRAVVLLSGGLDSTTVMAIAASRGMELTALSFRYGQRHTQELEMAAETARIYNAAEHVLIDLDPEPFRGSSLTGCGEVPIHGTGGRIPSTYVPARNTIFLSIALGIAETRNSSHIFIGVNSLDYSGYPDCRPEYIDAFRKLASLATKEAVQGNPPEIHAPLLHMTKAEIIETGLKLGVDYSKTVSCYRPDRNGCSCGVCDACLLRLEAFRSIKVKDPAAYA